MHSNYVASSYRELFLMLMETPCSEIHLYIAIATEILYCNMLDSPLSIHMQHVYKSNIICNTETIHQL